jgi:hypothetical protein
MNHKFGYINNNKEFNSEYRLQKQLIWKYEKTKNVLFELINETTFGEVHRLNFINQMEKLNFQELNKFNLIIKPNKIISDKTILISYFDWFPHVSFFSFIYINQIFETLEKILESSFENENKNWLEIKFPEEILILKIY